MERKRGEYSIGRERETRWEEGRSGWRGREESMGRERGGDEWEGKGIGACAERNLVYTYYVSMPCAHLCLASVSFNKPNALCIFVGPML